MTHLAAAPEPTSYDWPTTRTRAIQAFNGDTPGQTLEAAIVIHFQAEPVRVLGLIDAIGRRVSQGQVRSGWAVLRHELERKPPLVTASDGDAQEMAVRLAEAWIRNVGHLVDREEDLIEELFGVRGRLRWWPDLQPRMTELWRTRREGCGERVVVVGVGAGAGVVGAGAAAGAGVAGVAGSVEAGGVGVTVEAAPVSVDEEERLVYLDSLEIPEGDDAP